MKNKIGAFIFIFLSSGLLLVSQVQTSADQTVLESADQLFQDGKFAEAEKFYLEAIKEDPQNFRCLVHLGRIALLSNRLAESRKVVDSSGQNQA